VETGRTLAYLATFAGAVAAARLAPAGGPTVARGVLLATVAIAAYGLAARIWPGSFDESAFGGRISQPFDYWNALGGTAAIGIVPALWLGARRTGTALGRALAYPAGGVLIATVLITQSRGALLAAALACLLWIALVPLRLRSLIVLATAAAGAAPVAAWALSKDAFGLGLQPPAAREAVAGDFGLLMLATVVALLACGLAVEAVRARWRPSLGARRRMGVAVLAGTALVCLGLATSVALSDRGLTGTVSDRVSDFTSDDAAPPTGGGRLASTSSERVEYWRVAFRVFDDRPVTGEGAGAFEIARLRNRDDAAPAVHAHGFMHQTLADLGLLGGAAALALLVAWLIAAARATGIGPRRLVPRRPWTSERAALVALALAAFAYAAQSAADWTWFVPGVTVVGLVAAGFVAGRGPTARAAPDDRPAGTRSRLSAPRIAAAAGAALLALAFAWTIWQPVAADRAVARSYELIDASRPADALAEADEAHDRDSYAKDPLYARADALAAMGRPVDALRALRQVALDNPRDPDPWIRIATFQLGVLDSPAAALDAVAAGLAVDPHSPTLMRVRVSASRLLSSQAP
jgi:O-antigen ligase